MGYKVQISQQAKKAIQKIDKNIAKQILDCLDKVEKLDDPCSIGKPLTGNLSGLWRYRVGDWRVLCLIQRQELIVLVVKIGHRKDIYKSIPQDSKK